MKVPPFSFPGEQSVLADLPAGLWDQLMAAVGRECGAGDWHKYSKNAPWTWRAKQGERVIVYLTPEGDGVKASFALGARALDLVREAGLGRLVEGAKKYAEGTAVRVVVKGEADFDDLLVLIRAKTASSVSERRK